MKQQLEVLTGLRFFAAFYVFIFHIDLRKSLDFLDGYTHSIISQGAVGVNIFFILSGFILFYNYYDKRFSFNEFILRRLAKIYPVYFAGLVMCACLVFILGTSTEYFTELVMMNVLLVQSYFPEFSMRWYGGGSWSISTEFFFYISFPFLLSKIKNFSFRKAILALVGVYILSIVPGIFYHLGGTSLYITYTYPLARLPEFLAGMLCALIVFKYNFRVYYLLVFLVIFLSGLYFFYIGEKFQGYVIQNIVVIPITIALLANAIPAYIPRQVNLMKFMGTKWLVYLGKVSYSFYIVQIPICFILDYYQATYLQQIDSFTVLCVTFVVNLLLSMVMYHFIEEPFHKFFVKKIRLYYTKNN